MYNLRLRNKRSPLSHPQVGVIGSKGNRKSKCHPDKYPEMYTLHIYDTLPIFRIAWAEQNEYRAGKIHKISF